MQMAKSQLIIITVAMTLSSTAMAGKKNHGPEKHEHPQYAYGKVMDVTPIYHQVKVTTPVKECWNEPVTHTREVRHGANSAGGAIAGGLIGGIIGHQFGKGRGNKLSTAVGTLIGAQLGHDAVNGSQAITQQQFTRYEHFCEVEQQVSYEKVLDGYQVTYRYQGDEFQTQMPYDPGKKIKLRISVEPVF